MSPAWISSAAAKSISPKTWDEFIEVCKSLQQPPSVTGYGICLGLTTDTNAMFEYHLFLSWKLVRSR